MRKNLILIIPVCLCSLSILAQSNKGKITTSFSIGDIPHLSFEKDNFNYSFDPGVGYFISDHIETGIKLNYQRFHVSEQHSLIGIGEDGKTFSIQGYAHFYFGKGKLRPYMITQPGWEHSRWSTSYQGSTQNYNEKNIIAGLGAGLNWQISNKVSIFAEGLYRRHYYLDRPGSITNKSFSDSYFTIGIKISFGGKKHE